jgi:hypothetical protein
MFLLPSSDAELAPPPPEPHLKTQPQRLPPCHLSKSFFSIGEDALAIFSYNAVGY